MKKLLVAVLAVAAVPPSACAPAAQPVQAAPAPTSQVVAPATTTPESAAAAGECAIPEMLPNNHVRITFLPGVGGVTFTRPNGRSSQWEVSPTGSVLTTVSEGGRYAVTGIGPNGPCETIFNV